MIESIVASLPLMGMAFGGAIIITILAFYHPVTAISLALFLYAGPTFGLLPRIDGRPALVLVVAVLFLSGRRTPELIQSAQKRLRNILATVIVVIIAGIVSLMWTTAIFQTLSSLLALGLLGLTLIVLPRRLLPKQIFNAVMISAALIVFPSVILGLVGFSGAWRADRLAGILFNPNALAIYALLMGVGALFIPKQWIKWILLLIATLTIVLTASRGAGISLILCCLFYFWFTYRSIGNRIFQLASSGLMIFWVINSKFFADQSDNPSSIFRTNNSRENFNEIAINDIKQAWPFGTGLGTASEAAVNILFKLLAELGPFGVVVLLALVLLLFKSSWGIFRAVTVLMAGLVGNIFEGWLISAGNTFTIMFFLLLMFTVLDRNLTPNEESPTGIDKNIK